jgi:hypothetical protein
LSLERNFFLQNFSPFFFSLTHYYFRFFILVENLHSQTAEDKFEETKN